MTVKGITTHAKRAFKKLRLWSNLRLAIPWIVLIEVHDVGAKISHIRRYHLDAHVRLHYPGPGDPFRLEKTMRGSTGNRCRGELVGVKRPLVGFKRLKIMINTGSEVTPQDGFRYEGALIEVSVNRTLLLPSLFGSEWRTVSVVDIMATEYSALHAREPDKEVLNLERFHCPWKTAVALRKRSQLLQMKCTRQG